MKVHETCIRCGRKLTSQVSRERGFGTICWEKYQHQISVKPLFGCPADIERDSSNIQERINDNAKFE
jgi:hypothetical protein